MGAGASLFLEKPIVPETLRGRGAQRAAEPREDDSPASRSIGASCSAKRTTARAVMFMTGTEMTMQEVDENRKRRDPVLDPARRILIVDDEARIRLSLRSCLEAEGTRWTRRATASGRCARSARCKPDLVLLDLAMPRLDGMGMLREWRARFADKQPMPRVVVLTAWGSPAVEEEAFLCGVRDFIAKPLSPGALRAVVERVLRQPPTPRARA
jgi:PleD family two-component response regulator